MLTRRGLIGSLATIIAAPAIVRVSSIMPVKVMEAAGLYPERLIMDWSSIPNRSAHVDEFIAYIDRWRAAHPFGEVFLDRQTLRAWSSADTFINTFYNP